MAGLRPDESPTADQWQAFIERVGVAYRQADEDRSVLEKAAQLALKRSSAETIEPPGSQNRWQQATSPQQARLLLDASPDAVMLLNAELALVASNNLAALLQPGGAERPKELGDEDIVGIIGVDVYAQIKIAAQAVLQSQQSRRLIFDVFQGRGTQTFEARVVPLRANTQTPVAVFIRNWTPIARANRAAQMYKDLFDAASEGMMLLDKNQRVILLNRAFESMSGQTAEQLKAQDNPSFFDSAGKSLDTEIWSHVYYHDTWSGEAAFDHEHGMQVPVWLTVDALKDRDGNNTHFLILSSDISQLKETQEKLAHLATHDQLTGLTNRAYFQDRLSGAIARSCRSGAPGALFFMDLDNFKVINDTLGHPVGDSMLVEMAARLKKFVRDGELVSRIGGDEFTLVVENLARAEDAAIVAQRILKQFERPFPCAGQELDIGCSIGISVFPQDGEDRDKIIRQADTAMYSAKQAGRNTFKFYTSQLTHKAVQDFSVETQLKRAIDRDELFLTYQPQFDMKRRRLIGAEVLVRWNNEQHGMVSPAEFIPIAEANGLIEEIGAWVLDRACRQIANWRHCGGVPCLISVNVSRVQLVAPNFVQLVQDTLARHSVAGQELELEVTESALTASEKLVIQNLNGLRELGCKIAIDDFGTGYSSLSSLKKFPLDRLKIDRSFVQDLGQDANADAIIAAIIALAKSLGLSVIAEGVEDQQHVKALLKKGCREAQGYFYSKPLLAQDFREFILKSRRA